MSFNVSNPTNSPFKISRRVSFFDELKALSLTERSIAAALMLVLFIFVSMDIMNDFRFSASAVHIAVDFMFGMASLLGVILLWARFGRKHLDMAFELSKVVQEKDQASQQIEIWKSKADQLKEGISQEIDQHMNLWKLSAAEKEVGLLLLKGLSIKQIAELRGTSEGTTRQQSLAIYAKAGVTGRSELSAYFMEDFLDRKVFEKAPVISLGLK